MHGNLETYGRQILVQIQPCTLIFNFPYSKFFDATSPTVTFYRTARSLLVRAQMMVRAMSSCSSCSAWCRTGWGEYVRTCLMRSFPPTGSAPRTETCTRPHARTSDFIAISVGLLGGLVHCRRMPSCRTGRRRHGAAQTALLSSAAVLEVRQFMDCGANGGNLTT